MILTNYTDPPSKISSNLLAISYDPDESEGVLPTRHPDGSGLAR